MRDVLAEINAWRAQGKKVVIATNVRRDGSSLRPLGAKMAMTDEKPIEIAGSVTGGCIEGAVYEEGMQVLRGGVPKLLRYGIPNEDTPWEIGLTCGSSLEVFVEALDSAPWQMVLPEVVNCIEHNLLAAVVTVIRGAGLGQKLMVWADGRRLGGLGSAELDDKAASWAAGKILTEENTWTKFDSTQGEVELFVEVFAPTARMIVVGAVHIAIPLVSLAKTLGYRTIVIDPREAFATRERFPHADELLVEWPSTALEKLRLDEGSFVAVLSHDEKLDNPALVVALKSPARYVGVLGTKKKIGQRVSVLRELGLNDAELEKLRAPIGLHFGSILPEEIALSILGEMVTARRGLPKTQQSVLEAR